MARGLLISKSQEITVAISDAEVDRAFAENFASMQKALNADEKKVKKAAADDPEYRAAVARFRGAQ